MDIKINDIVVQVYGDGTPMRVMEFMGNTSAPHVSSVLCEWPIFGTATNGGVFGIDDLKEYVENQ